MQHLSPRLLKITVISVSLLAAYVTQATEPTVHQVEVSIETKYEWGTMRSLCPEVSALEGKRWKEVRRKLAQQGITELSPDSVEYGVLARHYEEDKANDSSIQYIFVAPKDSNILIVLLIQSGKLIGHEQGSITERYITNP